MRILAIYGEVTGRFRVITRATSKRVEPAAHDIAQRLMALRVLIVDDEFTMRKVTRSLLQAIGVQTIYEAHDGRSGLEAIGTFGPDVVMLGWEMPSPNGPEFVRTVRSPETFALPDVPIIMLTGYGERSRVVEAVKTWRQRFLAQAGLDQSVDGPAGFADRQAAQDGEEGRLLRARTAAAFELQTGVGNRLRLIG